MFNHVPKSARSLGNDPSPEAIVRAALERAAVDVSNWAPFVLEDADDALGIISYIRSLASDPDEVAAIIKAAGEDKG